MTPKSTTRRFCAIALLALLGLSTAVPASAQPAPQPAAQSAAIDETDFKAVYDRAQARAKAGEWQAALHDYRLAFKLANGRVDASVAVFHGRAALESKQFPEAATMYRYGLQRLAPSDPEYARVKPLIEARLAQAEAKTGKVEIVTTPAGAAITVDGQLKGRAPLGAPVYVAPGSHAFGAQLAGHTNDTVTVQVPVGTLTRVAIQLRPAGAANSAAPVNPLVSPEQADGMPPVFLSPGIAMVGLGVVGVAAAIVLGVTAGDRGAAADALGEDVDKAAPLGSACGNFSPIKDSASCRDLADQAQQEVGFRNAAIGAGIAGGALLTAGIVTLIVGANSDEQPAPQVGIVVAPSYAEVSLTGTF